MEDLYICWNFFDTRLFAPVKGNMTIYLDKFFPCSLTKFKKLMKVVKMDFSHEEELKAKLKIYFQNRISALKMEIEGSKRAAEALAGKISEGKIKERERKFQELFSEIAKKNQQLKQFERYLQFV